MPFVSIITEGEYLFLWLDRYIIWTDANETILYGFTRSFFTDRHFFVGIFLICLGLLTFSFRRYLV